MGGVWVPKDLPINLNTFHYVARNSLLKWWDCELVPVRKLANC